MYDDDELRRRKLSRLLYLLERACGTPDHVAEFLVDRHYLGLVGAGCSCPVAAYLSAGVGVPVLVDGFLASVLGDEYTYMLPWSVRDFIRNFDCGQYPDLQGDYHGQKVA